MPADSRDMVLVPREGWERARRFLSGCVDAGEIGPADGDNPADVFAALSASPVGEGASASPIPTEQAGGVVVGDDRQEGARFYAVKAAIERAMQDERDGKPCGCIVEAGCEARGYVDPAYAASGFIWQAAEHAVLAALSAPSTRPPHRRRRPSRQGTGEVG